ncbi:endoplasmin-like [Halichondria panicea]|uniref:endoplasmin-like n=1 Tax=Halichondria panicea TaxID=6063 RepID=UPI00312B32E5
MKGRLLLLAVLGLLCVAGCRAQEEDEDTPPPTADDDLGASRDGSRTDTEAVQREEEAIKLDGLSVAEMRGLRDKAEKHVFQAEVNRMMKLIINSLYRNKEIFLRELISNASDALDKIRFLALTDKTAMGTLDELSIKIKADPENNALHITDTGLGMTRKDLELNLGTIAKSGTTEFFEKLEAASDSSASDLIGQFGVGFYSSFLVADTVVVTSKHNDDPVQHIWESDASQFTIAEDPRGNTLQRGTTVSLFMKEEAREYLEPGKLRGLVEKYSQFINFPIYIWESKTETVDEPIEDESDEATPTDEGEGDDDEDAVVEDEEKEDKPKTKKVEKTTWDWVLVNDAKPLWLRNPKEIDEDEYRNFYRLFSKTSADPLAKIHFTAEGEVTFKAILFVPATAPANLFTDYAKATDKIKLYVRRVFITDNFEDMMPKYLNFVQGVVDSDDLPLNVSREMLQQHKLLRVIKKKLVRKALDMFKKLDKEDYVKFWKEYGTAVKLGVIEDPSNKTRLAKLLRFISSNDAEELTSLEQYLERMKEKQDHIYFMAAPTKEEASRSPFVERLLKKGYEVLYLVDPVDEYCVQSMPEFEGKKFQNVAKEGLEFGDEGEGAKEQLEEYTETYKPLTDWLKDDALRELIDKAVVSNRLTDSPCALVASQYGWSGNMERIMQAQAYSQGKESNFYATQKKTLEINPRHPLIKELQRRVGADEQDETTSDLARVLYETAVLRSGFTLKDSGDFAMRIERMLRLSMGVDLTTEAEKEEFPDEEEEEEEEVGDDEDEEDSDEDSSDDSDEGGDEGEEEDTESEGEEQATNEEDESPSKDEL